MHADGGAKVKSDSMLRLLMLWSILTLNVCVSLRFADGILSLDILLSFDKVPFYNLFKVIILNRQDLKNVFPK